MRINATVESILQNDLALIKIPRQEACEGCRACKMFTTDKFVTLIADNALGAKAKENVTVDLLCSDAQKPVLLLYGLPLAAFLTFSFTSYALLSFFEETLRALFAFILGCLAVAIVYIILSKKEKAGKFKSQIQSKIVQVNYDAPKSSCAE